MHIALVPDVYNEASYDVAQSIRSKATQDGERDTSVSKVTVSSSPLYRLHHHHLHLQGSGSVPVARPRY